MYMVISLSNPLPAYCKVLPQLPRMIFTWCQEDEFSKESMRWTRNQDSHLQPKTWEPQHYIAEILRYPIGTDLVPPRCGGWRSARLVFPQNEVITFLIQYLVNESNINESNTRLISTYPRSTVNSDPASKRIFNSLQDPKCNEDRQHRTSPKRVRPLSRSLWIFNHWRI